MELLISFLMYVQFLQGFEPMEANVSAYTSTEAQCDATPFITASGHHLRAGDRVVANNCLPFGTIVYIDGKFYEVQDRMNAKYGCDHMDIWLENYSEAIEWGRKDLIIYVRR